MIDSQLDGALKKLLFRGDHLKTKIIQLNLDFLRAKMNLKPNN